MTRLPLLLTAALLAVVAGCGGGIQENGRASTTTGPHTGDTAVAPSTTATSTLPAGQDPRDILGDDAELDDLAQACFEGDMFSCDTLFRRTEVDSDLEAYSQTCGGRIEEQAGAPGCADRFDAPTPSPQQPGDLGDDATFDALAQDCFDGDFGACDDLFLQTPVDSAYEAYGSTCGGRLEQGTNGACESQFGA